MAGPIYNQVAEAVPAGNRPPAEKPADQSGNNLPPQPPDAFISNGGFMIAVGGIDPNKVNPANGQAGQNAAASEVSGLQAILDRIIAALSNISTNPFQNIGRLMFSMGIALLGKANVDAKIAQSVDKPDIKEPLLTFSAKFEGLIGHIKASLDGWKEAAVSFIKLTFGELGKGQ